MRKLLSVVLIGSSLALCVLLAFQWVQAAKLWEKLEGQNREIFVRDQALQNMTNQLGILSEHVAAVVPRVDELKATIKTNEQQILQLRAELSRSEVLRTNLSLQIEQYKNAFEVATNKLGVAYDSIKQQNEVIKEAVAQRDSFVAQLNETIKDRNNIVQQYNDLVETVKTEHELTAQAAQASPRHADVVRQYQELLVQLKAQPKKPK